ncbi:MAG: large-conductance mechanosensitive channel protein MscL [Tidjanibacter sp.]|nr:large-conductance mechanosensitive channel protein MscL [Tidjanibacter sp.]
MSFLSEFKKFALKGNVVDMAVGVIIGGAFVKIVTSLVNDVIMPPLGMLIGKVNFTDLALNLGSAEAPVMWKYGAFLQQVFDFLIVAMCIFLLIKGINRLSELTKKKEEEEAAAPAPAPAPEPEPEPEPTKEEILLTEIRDLLKNK